MLEPGTEAAVDPPDTGPQVLIAGRFSCADLEPIRRHVRSWAHQAQLRPDAVFRLGLVVTELVTNVISHGEGQGRLRVSRRADKIICQVADLGPGIAKPHWAGWQPPSSEPDVHRGLWLVRMMCDRMTIDSSGLGTTVTVAIVERP